MNLNQLAKEITDREGGKKSVNIAQVKEVLGCLGEILAEAYGAEASDIFNKITVHGLKRVHALAGKRNAGRYGER